MSTPIALEVFTGETFYLSGGSETYGDAEFLSGSDVGGNDSFSGFNSAAPYIAYGDAYVTLDTAHGGNDSMSGGDNVGSGGSFSGDFFSGGVNFAGDAAYMDDRSFGGNDTLVGGDNSTNVLAGDALFTAFANVHGGNDALYGGDAFDGYATNMVLGDAQSFGGGLGPTSTVARGSDSSHVIGGNDYIEGGDAITNTVVASEANFLIGDAYGIFSRSVGGADEIHGGNAYAYADTGTDIDAGTINFIAGDAFVMQDSARGAADHLYGGTSYSSGGDAYAVNFMTGDAIGMMGKAVAGNDVMTGGDSMGPEVGPLSGIGAVTLNLMTGDAFASDGAVKFGNDMMTGGSGVSGGDGYVVNAMYGDSGNFQPVVMQASSSSLGASLLSSASSLSDLFTLGDSSARPPSYGNDTLIGGETQAQNYLVGDATDFIEGAKGGNDVLVGGGQGTVNMLIGDAEHMVAGSKGGNDRLVSNGGDDTMWGDSPDLTPPGRGLSSGGGADTFVFSPSNGVDVIEDFRPRERDKIDLKAFGGDDFRNFSSFVASGRMEETGDGVLLHLNDVAPRFHADVAIDTDTVLIVGVTLAQLTSSAFVF